MLFAPGPRDTSEPDPRLAWSRTLPRYAAAIRRDRKEALERLEMLRASRPRLPARSTTAEAARFRWLADRIEHAASEAPATPANDTPEPDPQPRAEPEARTEPAPPPPATPAATVTPEPGTAAPRPNRAQRRRLAALGRGAA